MWDDYFLVNGSRILELFESWMNLGKKCSGMKYFLWKNLFGLSVFCGKACCEKKALKYFEFSHSLIFFENQIKRKKIIAKDDKYLVKNSSSETISKLSQTSLNYLPMFFGSTNSTVFKTLFIFINSYISTTKLTTHHDLVAV